LKVWDIINLQGSIRIGGKSNGCYKGNLDLAQLLKKEERYFKAPLIQLK